MSLNTTVDAEWSISLDCYCPSCRNYVDLLETPDILTWIEPMEHDTERTTDMEVYCPKCGYEFLTTLRY